MPISSIESLIRQLVHAWDTGRHCEDSWPGFETSQDAPHKSSAYLVSLLLHSENERHLLLVASVGGDRSSLRQPAGDGALRDSSDSALMKAFFAAAPREVFSLDGEVTDPGGAATILRRIMEHRRRNPDLAEFLFDPLAPGHVIDAVSVRLACALDRLLKDYSGSEVPALIADACFDSSENIRHVALQAAIKLVDLPNALEVLEELFSYSDSRAQHMALDAFSPHADRPEVASLVARFFASEDGNVAVRAFKMLEASDYFLGEYDRMIRMTLEPDPTLTEAARRCFSDDEIWTYLHQRLDNVANGLPLEVGDIKLLWTTSFLDRHEVTKAITERLRLQCEPPHSISEVSRTVRELALLGDLWSGQLYSEVRQTVRECGDKELEASLSSLLRLREF